MASKNPNEANVVPYDHAELTAVKEALLGGGKLTPREEDPDVATMRIVNRILEGDVDSAFTPQTILKSEDLVDVPFTMDAVDWASSDFEEGPGVFAIVTATLLKDTFAGSRGDVVKVSLGGQQIIAQLYRAVTENRLGRDFVVRKASKATKRGYFPKWLEYAPATEAR